MYLERFMAHIESKSRRDASRGVWGEVGELPHNAEMWGHISNSGCSASGTAIPKDAIKISMSLLIAR